MIKLSALPLCSLSVNSARFKSSRKTNRRNAIQEHFFGKTTSQRLQEEEVKTEFSLPIQAQLKVFSHEFSFQDLHCVKRGLRKPCTQALPLHTLPHNLAIDENVDLMSENLQNKIVAIPKSTTGSELLGFGFVMLHDKTKQTLCIFTTFQDPLIQYDTTNNSYICSKAYYEQHQSKNKTPEESEVQDVKLEHRQLTILFGSAKIE